MLIVAFKNPVALLALWLGRTEGQLKENEVGGINVRNL